MYIVPRNQHTIFVVEIVLDFYFNADMIKEKLGTVMYFSSNLLLLVFGTSVFGTFKVETC